MIISESGQRFSSTDLSTNHTQQTGVVFPLASGDHKPNFAGIMEHRGHMPGKNHIAHFEYRIANGEVSSETGITYFKGRCLSYVSVEPNTLSAVEQAIELPGDSYATVDNMPNPNKTPIIRAITELWDALDFEPYTNFVLSTNLIKKEYKPVMTTLGFITKPSSSVTTTPEYAIGYIDACKKIKWLSTKELKLMSQEDLCKAVEEVNEFYYGEPMTLDYLTIAELIEEYLYTKEFIEQEIADDKTADYEFDKQHIADSLTDISTPGSINSDVLEQWYNKMQ